MSDMMGCDSKAVAVAILATSGKLDDKTSASLTPGLISGIIAAETKRKSWGEGTFEWVTGTGGGMGPGQMYKPAHTDVTTQLKDELDRFIAHMNANCDANIRAGGFPADVTDKTLADFFIAGYLALQVKRSQRSGRSADDALQYGIGLYHGARATLVKAQQAVGASTGGNVTAYAPVKTHMLASKDSEMVDVAKYIDEVFKSR